MTVDNDPLFDVPADDVAPDVDKPKRSRSRGTGRPPGRPRKDQAPTGAGVPGYRPGKYKQPITGLYGTLGMAVSLARPQTGMAIMAQAEAAAAAWDKAARQNPTIRRVLDAALTTSVWSELVIAHLPIVLALLGEAGVLDGSPLAGLAGMSTAPQAAQAPTPAPSAPSTVDDVAA